MVWDLNNDDGEMLIASSKIDNVGHLEPVAKV
jgi:hypothetical protein